MTQEQEKEFAELLQGLPSRGGYKVYTHADLMQCMEAAYNLAVRKCAETAEMKYMNPPPDQTLEIDRDSILKNLI